MSADNPHPELHLRFVRACGVDTETVQSRTPLPSTRAWADWLIKLSKDDPWYAAVAAHHCASEFQGVNTFKSILPALREKYGFAEADIEHFWLHAEVDVGHSGRAFDALERHCNMPEIRQRVIDYVAEGARMRWFHTDCIYLHYELDALQGLGLLNGETLAKDTAQLA